MVCACMLLVLTSMLQKRGGSKIWPQLLVRMKQCMVLPVMLLFHTKFCSYNPVCMVQNLEASA